MPVNHRLRRSQQQIAPRRTASLRRPRRRPAGSQSVSSAKFVVRPKVVWLSFSSLEAASTIACSTTSPDGRLKRTYRASFRSSSSLTRRFQHFARRRDTTRPKRVDQLFDFRPDYRGHASPHDRVGYHQRCSGDRLLCAVEVHRVGLICGTALSPRQSM